MVVCGGCFVSLTVLWPVPASVPAATMCDICEGRVQVFTLQRYASHSSRVCIRGIDCVVSRCVCHLVGALSACQS